MIEADLRATVRAWGNSYGIVIPADVARRLGLRPGEPLDVHLAYEPARNDASRLTKWRLAEMPDIDKIIDEDLGADEDARL